MKELQSRQGSKIVRLFLSLPSGQIKGTVYDRGAIKANLNIGHSSTYYSLWKIIWIVYELGAI